MNSDYWKKFVEKSKKEYYKIGSISCPAFGSEKVSFNKYGWNHLIRKGRKFRDNMEQKERLELLPYVKNIISNTTSIYRDRITRSDYSCCYFWEIRRKVIHRSKHVTIHVIIRKKNDGRLHFFSIF